jgi:MFS family permease
MLAAVFIVLSFVLNGMLAHLVPMLVDRGMDTKIAAAVAATEGITVFFSRIVIGYLIDHIFAPFVAVIFFSLSAVGMGLFAAGAVDTMAFVGAVCVGLSLGAEIDLLAYLTGRYFGLKSFGTAYGFLFSAVLAGSAIGPLAFGIGFDTTGSYVSILTICVAMNILAVILTAFLGRYPDWEKAAAAD